MHNTDIVEIIRKRVSNAELSHYLTALKVKFQHQPLNYKEVIQDIASQVPYIGVENLRKASEVSVQGTELGGAPYQGIYDSNMLLFYGTYLEKKWFSDLVKPHWEYIRRDRDASNCNSDIATNRHRGRPDRRKKEA